MVISKVIIRVTPCITLLITYLLSPLPLQVGFGGLGVWGFWGFRGFRGFRGSRV